MKIQDLSALVDDLEDIYRRSAANLRHALAAYLRDGTRPDPVHRADGAFAYPELRVIYAPEAAPARVLRAFARVIADFANENDGRIIAYTTSSLGPAKPSIRPVR